MKIVVYAICKNESGFVDRWMDSMQEADRVIVLDTGSTDDTVQKLRSRGARVYEEQFSPWRFDTARNRSLELVDDDADLCVCTDLDEYFLPGWRAELERVWSPGVTQVRYPYVWSFRADGSDGVTFWYEKIHARHGYKWTHPVHEVLSWIGEGTPGKTVDAPGSSWTITRIRKNPGDSTCRCWSSRCGRTRTTTATPTIWGGNTSTTGAGTTASAP